MTSRLEHASAIFFGCLLLACGPLSGATAFTTTKTPMAATTTRQAATDVVNPSCPVCECNADSEAAAQEGLPLMIAAPVILFLIMMSGLFSGLTLGLMGLDLIGLETIINGDNGDDAKCAAKIRPVREKGNMLLCTLLLGNVAVNSALAILTAGIPFLNGTTGFLVSTGLIVIFGEIIPQATCSKYALQIGAKAVCVVNVLMVLMSIVTYPMALALDKMLGKDLGQIYSTDELIEMVKLQIARGAGDEGTGEELKRVMQGCLHLRDQCVKDVMTAVDTAYMLNSDAKLDYDTVREIFEQGFSRIPVYGTNRNDCVGLLCTKDLILADPEDEMRVSDFIKVFHRQVLNISEEEKLPEALARFKENRTHLGLVRRMNTAQVRLNPECEVIGIVTLEDIVEEILQDEIVDEADVYVDVASKSKTPCSRPQFDLGIFNPVWQNKKDCLTSDEVRAIAAHLCRELFGKGSRMALGTQSVEWLVSISEVQSRERVADTVGVHDERDQLYKVGKASRSCTLILQGRARVQVGRDGFQAEAGSFKILAADALIDEAYIADFNAYLSTPHVRLLCISSKDFKEAKALDKDPVKLNKKLSGMQQLLRSDSSLKGFENSDSYSKRLKRASRSHISLVPTSRGGTVKCFSACLPQAQAV